MRKNSKRPIIVAVLGLTGLLVSACSSGSAASNASEQTGGGLARIQKSGKLRYGVIVGEAPGFIKGADGKWSGYCAEIAQKIATELNLEPVPVVTTWGNMALDLKSNKLDLADCAQPTGKRALVVDYASHAIYTNYFSLIVRDPNLKVEKWSDLDKSSMKIGVQTGDSTVQPIKDFAPSAQVVTFQTREEALLALQNGRVNAVANTLLNSLQAVKSRSDLNGRVVVPGPLVAAPSGVMVARNADQSFLHAVDTVVWNISSSGFDRAVILKYLKQSGITSADLPANATL